MAHTEILVLMPSLVLALNHQSSQYIKENPYKVYKHPHYPNQEDRISQSLPKCIYGQEKLFIFLPHLQRCIIGRST